MQQMYNLETESRVKEKMEVKRRGRCRVLEHIYGPMRDELKGAATTSSCPSQTDHYGGSDVFKIQTLS